MFLVDQSRVSLCLGALLEILIACRTASPEEDEAEKEVRKALQALHQTQKTMECHRTLTALLDHGDYALSNAAPHLSVAVSSGKKGADSKVFQSEIIGDCLALSRATRIFPNF